jgi:hypothetical protein
MIEKLRGRSTETKYGRIPLWLYETGISLQAIATYGWLHGRYGHYERVMPSYNTLARELNVSRGSVIAYVKILVSVGAVRIETSGAAGQQSNLYAIAFNEPFEVAEEQAKGGQPADHLVGQLYQGGQRADSGGQRAVQEEDIPKKTKKTLSPPEQPQPAAEDPPASPGEREIFAKAMNDDTAKVAEAWSLARGGRRNSASEEKVRASAASLLAVGWLIPDLIALAEDMAAKYPAGTDLTKHEAHWTPGQKPSPVRLRPWCGCGGNPAAEFNGKFRTHNGTAKGQPCLICHPDAMQESA